MQNDYHILVVDDDQDVLKLVSTQLEAQGYTVDIYTTGQAALADISNKHPDLILLDILMPGMDGFEVCNKLKNNEQTESIPVVFLSGKDDHKSMVKGLELGAVDYIIKPFDRAVLSARVHTHATLGRLNRSLHEEVQRQTKDLHNLNGQLRELAAEMALAEERERQRLATALHDTAIQNLALAQISLDESQPGNKKTWDLLEDTITDLRGLLFELSPPVLTELGLEAALDWLAENTSTRSDTQILFTTDGPCETLTDERAILLFQIARELVNNVIKHADASYARIILNADDPKLIQLSVRDDGQGFSANPEDLRPTMDSGFGLFSIRQRLQHFGGDMDITQAVPGTHINIKLPL